MAAVGFAAAPAAATNHVGTVGGDANFTSGGSYYAGQEIGLAIPNSTTSADQFEIRSYDSGDDQIGTVADGFVLDNNRNATIDTSDLDGDYVVVNANNRNEVILFSGSNGVATGTTTNSNNYDTGSFQVSPQSLSMNFEDDSTGNDGSAATTTLEVDSNRPQWDVIVSSSGLDQDEVNNAFDDAYTTNTSDGDLDDDEVLLEDVTDGDVDVNFTDIDNGEYEFTFEVADTDAEDTATINVTDTGDGEVNIAEGSLNQQQGDIVEFTVTADGASDEGFVVIGDEDDFGYQANVSITDFGDDEEITLAFNSYTAGLDSDDTVTVVDTDDEDDAIEFDATTDETSLDGILASGDYDVSSSAITSGSDDQNAADTLDSSDDVATMFLEEPTTEGVQVWTASNDNADEVISADEDEQVDELTSAIENDLITQSSDVAYDDVSIHQISASGLEGALEYATIAGSAADDPADQLAYLATNNVSNTLNGDTAVELRVRETRSSAGPNQDRRVLNLTSTDFDVIVDEENDEYYLAFDTANAAFDNGDVADDEDVSFDVEFTVQDQRLLDPDDDVETDEFEDSYTTVSTPFSINERTVTFDQDPYNLTNVEDATVTGTTNAAPGSEFTIRARSDTGTQPSFVESDDEVNVSADGTWEAEIDLSDASVGDEYTLSVQQLSLPETEEVDGTVVEQVQEPATFTVSDLSPQDVTATVGDALTVTATVENTGELESTQTVEFRVGGNAVASQDVTLAGGNSTTVEFADIDTSGLDAGDYEHGVFTDDDSSTATLTLEAADTDDTGGDDTGGDDTGGDDTGGDDTGGDDTGGDDTGGDDTGGDDT
ncbi:BGTF surface domain-containing protein, partial [Halorubrum ezzemoulense]